MKDQLEQNFKQTDETERYNPEKYKSAEPKQIMNDKRKYKNVDSRNDKLEEKKLGFFICW